MSFATLEANVPCLLHISFRIGFTFLEVERFGLSPKVFLFVTDPHMLLSFMCASVTTMTSIIYIYIYIYIYTYTHTHTHTYTHKYSHTQHTTTVKEASKLPSNNNFFFLSLPSLRQLGTFSFQCVHWNLLFSMCSLLLPLLSSPIMQLN